MFQLLEILAYDDDDGEHLTTYYTIHALRISIWTCLWEEEERLGILLDDEVDELLKGKETKNIYFWN